MKCTHRRRRGSTRTRWLKSLANVDLFGNADELGYVNIKPEQTNIFFKLMESGIIAAHFDYDESTLCHLADFLANPALTKALLSRLRERWPARSPSRVLASASDRLIESHPWSHSHQARSRASLCAKSRANPDRPAYFRRVTRTGSDERAVDKTSMERDVIRSPRRRYTKHATSAMRSGYE